MSSSVDATELLGCFEQVDLSRHKKLVMHKTRVLLNGVCAQLLSETTTCLQTTTPTQFGATVPLTIRTQLVNEWQTRWNAVDVCAKFLGEELPSSEWEDRKSVV